MDKINTAITLINEAHDMLAKSKLGPEQYNPISECLALAKTELYAASIPTSPAPVWVKASEDLPEDNECCFWCAVPTVEPPYVGSMCDEDFNINYYTHWRKIDNDFFPEQ